MRHCERETPRSAHLVYVPRCLPGCAGRLLPCGTMKYSAAIGEWQAKVNCFWYTFALLENDLPTGLLDCLSHHCSRQQTLLPTSSLHGVDI